MDTQHSPYTPHSFVMGDAAAFKDVVVLELVQLRDATKTHLTMVEAALAEALGNLPIIQLDDRPEEIPPRKRRASQRAPVSRTSP